MAIESYDFGCMTVEGKIYNADLIIFPDHIKSHWRRKEGHTLSQDDLEEVFKTKPEILVIGKGFSGRMQVPLDTKKALEYAHIQVIDKTTGEAWQIFNQEKAKGKNVAGAFHLTC